MHAVVVSVTISDFDRGRQLLEEEVVPRVSQAPGFVAGYWTRAEDNSGLSMMVFESEDAARGAAEFIRTQSPPSDAVTVETVEVREVVASA
jgi:hypothetical protein